jgi:HEPN domain-containing protein
MPQDPQGIIAEMMTSWLNNYRMDPTKDALIRGYLETSREDQKASRLLYDHGQYALAVYHLQQAVEKATKAQCLMSGRISVEDMKKIKHESLRGQQIFATKLSGSLKMLARAYPQLNLDLSQSGRIMERFGKKRNEIARIDGVTIDKLLSWYDAKFERANLPSALAVGEMEKILLQVVKGFPELSSADTEELRKMLKGITPGLISSVRDLPFLFIASALTSPHWMSTRYPGGDIEPSGYNDSMGIVSRMPQLIDRVGKLLHSFEFQINRVPD